MPNSYDQLSQDQKQRVMTWSIAPGYQHTFSANTLLTVNPYGRRDQMNYYPSRDIFADNPATAQQTRFLTNYGIKADISHAHGRHNLKVGHPDPADAIARAIPVRHYQSGLQSGLPRCVRRILSICPTVTNPAQCATVNPSYQPNPDLQPGIVPYDLTRGGSLFTFYGKHNINQYAFYVTDAIRVGNFTSISGFATTSTTA